MPHALTFINPSLSTQNVGDLFIEDSVKRILIHDRQRSIDIDPRKPITAAMIDQINATDAAVIVGTNLWYRDMPKPGRWQFTLDQLKKIRVPIIPLGIGTTRHGNEDNGFTPETLAQLKLIHESCQVASARDWRTVEALEQAGIRNATMTGCPTLYRSLAPVWKLNKPASRGQLVVTVRKGARGNVRRLLKLMAKQGLSAVVAAQQEPDNFLRPWLPLIRPLAPTLYEYKMQSYRGLVDESLGAIGWRLHGNMLHLAHGNPAIFFANCSRAKSFCESFALPCVDSPDHTRLSNSVIAEALERFFDPATFVDFPRKYAHYRKRMGEFLTANGLEHHLSEAAVAKPRRGFAA